MKRKKIESVPLLKLPVNLRIALLPDNVKITYVYTAAMVEVDRQSILEVDFYSLTAKGIAFRTFITANDFISQKFSKTGSKWSEAMLENIFTYNDQCVPSNKRSDQVIKKFLSVKDPDEQKGILHNLELFQTAIRKSQLKIRHDKIKARIDKVFSGIEDIPENIGSWINEYPLGDYQYIFYRTAGRKKNGYCSVCQNAVELFGIKHNQKGVCPKCGHSVTFKSEGISHNTYNRFVFSILQKSLDGGLISRVFEGFKSYKDGYTEPKLSYYEARRYICQGNFVTAYHYGNFMNTNEYRWCEGYPNTYGGYRTISDVGCLFSFNLRGVLLSTIWLDCGIELFAQKFQLDVVDYFLLYNKQKGIQYLAENGLHSLIYESLFNHYKLSGLDDNLFTIIRSNKSFFPMFRDINVLADELLVFDACKIGKKISKDELLRIREWEITHDFIGVLKYTSASKAINYIEKQNLCEKNARQTIILWLDYIEICTFLGYNLSSLFVLFPKNLKQEHDRANEEQQNQKAFICDERIKAMYSSLNGYFAYSDKQFLIRAPRDSNEIRNEGAALRHCVDRYLERVVRKECVILFVRQVSKPDVPYYTVEYNENEIRQCRGMRNNDPTEDINKFLSIWLKTMVNRSELSSEIVVNL